MSDHVKAMLWDRCVSCQFPWPCREALIEQLAAEREAREVERQEEFGWKEAYDGLVKVRNSQVDDALDLMQTTGEELATARDLLAARDTQRCELRQAIILDRNRDYDGGPCWCWTADTEQGYDHRSTCQTLRALLAPPAAVGAVVGFPCDACGQQINRDEHMIVSEDGEGHQFRTHEQCAEGVTDRCSKCLAQWPAAVGAVDQEDATRCWYKVRAPSDGAVFACILRPDHPSSWNHQLRLVAEPAERQQAAVGAVLKISESRPTCCLNWAYDPATHGEWDFNGEHHPACAAQQQPGDAAP